MHDCLLVAWGAAHDSVCPTLQAKYMGLGSVGFPWEVLRWTAPSSVEKLCLDTKRLYGLHPLGTGDVVLIGRCPCSVHSWLSFYLAEINLQVRLFRNCSHHSPWLGPMVLSPTRGAGSPCEGNQGNPRNPRGSLTVLNPHFLEVDPGILGTPRIPGNHPVDIPLTCPSTETGHT